MPKNIVVTTERSILYLMKKTNHQECELLIIRGFFNWRKEDYFFLVFVPLLPPPPLLADTRPMTTKIANVLSNILC